MVLYSTSVAYTSFVLLPVVHVLDSSKLDSTVKSQYRVQVTTNSLLLTAILSLSDRTSSSSSSCSWSSCMVDGITRPAGDAARLELSSTGCPVQC